MESHPSQHREIDPRLSNDHVGVQAAVKEAVKLAKQKGFGVMMSAAFLGNVISDDLTPVADCWRW